jgi:hypothetical protein
MFEKYKTAGRFSRPRSQLSALSEERRAYFITGGGGAPLYDVDTPPADITKIGESTEHFVVVKLEGRKARVQALRLDGRPLEITALAH